MISGFDKKDAILYNTVILKYYNIPSVQEVVTPFYIVSYYIKRATISWTYSKHHGRDDLILLEFWKLQDNVVVRC